MLKLGARTIFGCFLIIDLLDQVLQGCGHPTQILETTPALLLQKDDY